MARTSQKYRGRPLRRICARKFASTRKTLPRDNLALKATRHLIGFAICAGDKSDDESNRPEQSMAITLPFSTSEKNEDTCSNVSKYPPFDINDEDLASEYLPGFAIRRETEYVEHVLPELLGKEEETRMNIAKDFVDSACKGAKAKYPRSSWVIISFKNPLNKNSLTIEAEEHADPSYVGLKEMLHTGELYGCELRGKKETAQFGLVATKDLPLETPVAVEAGLIWTEELHDKKLIANDPMLGLSANFVCSHLLKQFASKEVWEKYKKSNRLEDGRIGGLVIECSSHGNETKQIDDPGWMHAEDDMPVLEPTLNAFCILDLKRSMPTVGFFTSKPVKEGEELMMDWGCWAEISELFLPGQTLLSILAHDRKEKLIAQFRKEHIDWEWHCRHPELPEDLQLFQPKQTKELAHRLQGLLKTSSICLRPRVDVLCEIMDYNAKVSDQSKRIKVASAYSLIKFDHESPSARMAVMPQDPSSGALSAESIEALRECGARIEADSVVQDFYSEDDNLSDRVRVVQISDPRHPACLFSLPESTARGVIANKDFKRGEAVLCYGGELRDFESSDLQFDSYLFDLDLSDYNYGGPQLFISGRNSVGGMINDPRSFGNMKKMAANLTTFVDWDKKSGAPQIVFAALRAIRKGEELFYDYGSSYWKIMWRNMMHSHATYATKTNAECEALESEMQ